MYGSTGQFIYVLLCIYIILNAYLMEKCTKTYRLIKDRGLIVIFYVFAYHEIWMLWHTSCLLEKSRFLLTNKLIYVSHWEESGYLHICICLCLLKLWLLQSVIQTPRSFVFLSTRSPPYILVSSFSFPLRCSHDN